MTDKPDLTVEEFARISSDFKRLGHIGYADTKRLIAAAGDWIQGVPPQKPEPSGERQAERLGEVLHQAETSIVPGPCDPPITSYHFNKKERERYLRMARAALKWMVASNPEPSPSGSVEGQVINLQSVAKRERNNGNVELAAIIEHAAEALKRMAGDIEQLVHANESANKKTCAVEEENERLRTRLDALQLAEAAYRCSHDTHGSGAMETGRAWDRLRKSGDKARAALQGREVDG